MFSHVFLFWKDGCSLIRVSAAHFQASFLCFHIWGACKLQKLPIFPFSPIWVTCSRLNFSVLCLSPYFVHACRDLSFSGIRFLLTAEDTVCKLPLLQSSFGIRLKPHTKFITYLEAWHWSCGACVACQRLLHAKFITYLERSHWSCGAFVLSTIASYHSNVKVLFRLLFERAWIKSIKFSLSVSIALVARGLRCLSTTSLCRSMLKVLLRLGCLSGRELIFIVAWVFDLLFAIASALVSCLHPKGWVAHNWCFLVRVIFIAATCNLAGVALCPLPLYCGPPVNLCLHGLVCVSPGGFSFPKS